jgi:hypothetical protein
MLLQDVGFVIRFTIVPVDLGGIKPHPIEDSWPNATRTG